MSTLDDYKKADAALPEEYLAWQVFGAGLENVGRDGKPVAVPLRDPKDNEVLMRVDVLGLCLSDMKIIAQGGDHPRLRGRDLANDPTVLGHECAATIVKVGKDWQDQFQVGERYIVQADAYYKGVGYAFGYIIPGGLAEYAYVDEIMLAGDEGCYLLPVADETGYSQSALAEPWACVEMSYCLEDRLEAANDAPLMVSDGLCEGAMKKFPNATVVARSLEAIDALGDQKFMDIILHNPDPALVTAVNEKLDKGGNLWLLGEEKEDGMTAIDVGAIHYENQRVFGGGAHKMAELGELNKRNDLLPGGKALFIGAGGPMGQMHVQRALEKADGPQTVVVTDLDRGRLDYIVNQFQGLADKRGAELITLSPGEFESQEAMNAKIEAIAPDGYNDLIVLAPVPFLVTQAAQWAAPNAFMNVFAGLATGTKADIPLSKLCQGLKIIGSSGSRIADLNRILELAESNQLDTNRSVAAIGGLNAAHEGLQAVKNATFPGKTVIYTQIADLPLMPLTEVPEKIPELKDKLSPEGAWTNEAEAALLELYAK